MKKLMVLGFALAALVAFVKCGKSSDDEATSADSMTTINSLNVSCGTKKASCLGTEAE